MGIFEQIGNIFRSLFYNPLLDLLLFFYEQLPGGFGVAVILLTVGVKIALLPIELKAKRSQKAISKIQPKIKKAQKEYNGDKEKLAQETMKIYREEGINPLASIGASILQIPILFAIYQVFREAPSIEGVNPLFLGIDLSASSWVFAGVTAVFYFFQMQLAPSTGQSKGGSDFSDALQKQMKYFFPVFIFFVLSKVPSAIALYLTIGSLFSIIQSKIVD